MRHKSILIVFILGLLTFFGGYYYLTKDLPSLDTARDYQPNLVTKVYSGDNRLIGEFYIEKRVVVPFEKIPKQLIDAFLAAEDSKFYEHEGINYMSILRAFYKNVTAGRIVQGGSTITQQVARSFFLSSERKISRKIKEVIMAYRLERNLSKNEILSLYLNQIYFGNGAYGIQTAAETYYGKDVERLTLAEAALLAGLPKAPSKYSPMVNFQLAKERQVFVLKRMMDEGYITGQQMEKAVSQKIIIKSKDSADNLWVGPYFTEHVRRYIEDKYGDDVLYKDGLSVYTTMDVDLQKAANDAVLEGLKAYDRRRGYRGPSARLKTKEETEKFLKESDMKFAAAPVQEGGVYQGVIASFNPRDKSLTVYLGTKKGVIYEPDLSWARLYNTSGEPDGGKFDRYDRIFHAGDVIDVSVETIPANEKTPLRLELTQTPVIQTSLVALEPETGKVKALVGGSDFARSQFNRAVQSMRQPGSAFKPVIYAAAMDSAFTPAAIVMDTPIVFDNAPPPGNDKGAAEEEESDQWRPQNYDDKFTGPTTVRDALARSRNVITIKILKEIGVDKAVDYARRLGITAPLAHDLSLALGSSAVNLLELTTAYATFENQGVKPVPYFITKITTKEGAVIEENLPNQHAQSAAAPMPAAPAPQASQAAAPEPSTTAENAAVTVPAGPAISRETAYIMTSLLQGVIENGTGKRARALGRPAAGKTGTTNNLNDAWFIGYVPGLAAGAWIGYDEEKPLGRGETGAAAALPIWLKFMQAAVRGTPVRHFPVPDGVEFAKIDPATGLLANAATPNAVFEVFKAGTTPKAVSKGKNPVSQEDFFMMDTAGKPRKKPEREPSAD
ncbi:MAG: PBP1A family penicillin-binding protein [Deltaproteobacteria bacterium]|nr:PBP1A family penicillin-binding protein [Deltaproteobacteria bacterium]